LAAAAREHPMSTGTPPSARRLSSVTEGESDPYIQRRSTQPTRPRIGSGPPTNVYPKREIDVNEPSWGSANLHDAGEVRKRHIEATHAGTWKALSADGHASGGQRQFAEHVQRRVAFRRARSGCLQRCLPTGSGCTNTRSSPRFDAGLHCRKTAAPPSDGRTITAS
jgi:hypothetical protein